MSDHDATDAAGTAEDPSEDTSGRTRTRTRSRRAAPAPSEGSAPEDRADDEGSASPRRRRGSRGRGRRRQQGSGDSGQGNGGGAAGSSEASSDADDPQDDTPRIAKGGTRLAAKRQARDRRGRRHARRGRRSSALSDDVRQAMLEGPPRTMLVSTTGDRTQIAVLEDRTLVEHYVARKDTVSYVGNIYMARVQNVLPGMEAAFLDIGQGRNGVLYAGEVLYDELDLDEDDEPRIEQALKPGQKVLVQVTKDAMGSKGPRLSMQLSLAGRYMVLAPNDRVFGISRKLSDAQRDRLRTILQQLKPEGQGIIIRTAAAEASEEQLTEDLQRLVRRWDAVAERADNAEALEAVYQEPDLVVRVVRDIFGPDVERVVVDDADVHTQLKEYLEEVMPDALDRLELYQPPEPERRQDKPQRLFDAYHAGEQLEKALERKVWLPSGGYLIIDRTEAMTVIDVNTGRFTGDSSLEETVLQTNLEAAHEIVRQLRLRDIGGMILIDFIDMLLEVNQDQVVRTLKRELLRDRTKTRVSEVSRLGLVQMTRKNVSQGLLEVFSKRCETCEGRGVIVSLD